MKKENSFNTRTQTTDPRGLITSYSYGLIPPPKDSASSEAEMEPQILFNDSPDAGKLFLLLDVTQKPHRRWNSRGFAYRHEGACPEYSRGNDLQRPTELWVTPDGSSEYLAEKNVYGESQGASLNHRGQLYQSFDQAGKLTVVAYDFKGNAIQQERQFAEEYQTALDYDSSVNYETETFEEEGEFDALNRPSKQISADDTERLMSYKRSGLLEAVELKVKDGTTEDAITDIYYNARGQRTDVYYANGSKTAYTYDTATFRLKRILSTRNTGADILQDLNYTFDAAGNIVHLKDDAQQTIYFDNSVVIPENKYEYDALYRLKKAEGREQASLSQPTDADIAIITPVPDTNTTALRSYTQNFTYDELGNIEEIQHLAGTGSYTKDYFYPSTNNRLIGHSSGIAAYTYDEHGNMTSMPHLSNMLWDYNDLLLEADLGGGGTAYYRYDAGGNRVRKVIENGSDKKERLYLNGFELWQESTSGTVQTKRETLLVTDDQKQFLQLETLTIDSGSSIGTPTTNWRFQYDNYIGSACLETDASANIISYEEYHPFGTSSYRSGSSTAEVSLKRYRYVGKEKDDETGLFNYGARLYAPWLARFISSDLLRDKYPYLNSYNYAGNKPITYYDIDGMQSNEDDPILLEHEADNTKVVPALSSEQLFKKPLKKEEGVSYEVDNENKTISISLGVDLINLSGQSVNLKDAASDIENYIKDTYQGVINYNGDEYTVATNVTVNPVERISETTDTNLLLVLAEFKTDWENLKDNSEILGQAAGFSGEIKKVAYVDVDLFQGIFDTFIGSSGEHIATHELTHLFGLKDLVGVKFKDRLLSNKYGTELTSNDFNKILEGIDSMNTSFKPKFSNMFGVKSPISPPYIKTTRLNMQKVLSESRKKQ